MFRVRKNGGKYKHDAPASERVNGPNYRFQLNATEHVQL